MPKTTQLSYLSEAQQKRIHQASLEILDRLGVFLYDEEAVALFRKARARVAEGNRVHIPPRLTEWAWSADPRSITLSDRSGSPVMPLEEQNVFFGNGSDCPFMLDHRTGERRLGTLQDVVDVARISDALPNIDFLMSGCVPSDVAEERANRLQMRTMLLNSSKSIMFVTNDFESCVDVIRAAEIVACSAEALRVSPQSVGDNSTSLWARTASAYPRPRSLVSFETFPSSHPGDAASWNPAMSESRPSICSS